MWPEIRLRRIKMITDWINEQSDTVSEFIFTYKQGISNKDSRHKMEVALREIMNAGTYPYEQLYTVVDETVKNQELKDIVMTDICPFSLGISSSYSDLHVDRTSFIIQRNTPLPASEAKL